MLRSTKRLRAPSAAVQYAIAAILVFAGLAVRLWMYPAVALRSPLVVFVLPTLLAAMFGRFGPPAFATFLSALGAAFLLMEPVGSPWVSDPSDRVRLGLFVVQNLMLGSLVAGIQRARLRASIAAVALAESAHFLEDIVDNSPHAIVAVNLDGTVRAWNAAAERIFGWSAREVIGLPLPIIPAESRDSVVRDVWTRAAAGEVVDTYRAERLHQNGSVILCDISAGPLRDADGKFVGVVATLTDVSQEHKLHEQLRQAQKMEGVGELAAGVAHDFNNHLTAIIGYAQLAAEALPPNDPVLEDLKEIERAAETSAALTRRLLSFSSRQVLQLKPLDVSRVIRSCEQMLRRTVREDVVIQTDLESRPAWVVADPAQLEHILLNLVVNARDAMPNGGLVRIQTSSIDINQANAASHLDLPFGAYVVVTVSDTGIGMSDEVQRRVFEPFFTTKAAGRGTGLGLPMVQSTVRQMGGSIGLTSVVGKGTRFQMYFPRVTSTDTGAPAAKRTRAGGGAETVLLVDDDDSVRRLAVRTLENEGYRVVQAATVGEAIVAVRSSQPDLLLTDVVMPGMNGPDLAKVLADLGVSRVLFMSGYMDQPAFGAQVQSGAVAFLAKPFAPDELVTKVRDVLDQADPVS